MIGQLPERERRLFVRDDAEMGPGARRISFDCPHGRTERIVFPGSRGLGDALVRDLVVATHGAATACSCAEALRTAAYAN